MSDSENLEQDGVYNGAETTLLKNALALSPFRSARAAAEPMDLSDTRLRHIINGYQPVGRGQRIAVVGPADTIARIAQVLKVSAEELREAGRGDAASVLERRESGNSLLDTDQILDELGAWAEDPEGQPPDDGLRFYSDSSLLGELSRRLGSLRGYLDGQAPEGHLDVTFHPRPFAVDRDTNLPRAADEDDDMDTEAEADPYA